jgi:hypothetical protein
MFNEIISIDESFPKFDVRISWKCMASHGSEFSRVLPAEEWLHVAYASASDSFIENEENEFEFCKNNWDKVLTILAHDVRDFSWEIVAE